MARVNGPPPGRSIYDATPASQGSQAIKVNAPTVPEAQDVDAVSRAAKELSNTARSDHQRIDLTDLLSHTSRESSYSEVPAGVRMHRHSLTQPFAGLQSGFRYYETPHACSHSLSCSGLPYLVKRPPSLGLCQTWYWTVSDKCRQPASVVSLLKPSLHGLQWTMSCMFGMPAG